MRQQAQRAKREARMQAQADKLAMLPREMVSMGLTEDAICAELEKLKVWREAASHGPQTSDWQPSQVEHADTAKRPNQSLVLDLKKDQCEEAALLLQLQD